MRSMFRALTVFVVIALLLAACSGGTAPAKPAGDVASTATTASKAMTNTASSSTTSTNTTGSADGKNDLLADITKRGVLRVSTDPAYPPQSELVEGAKKPAGSKCTGEEHTAGEFKGFDIDVAVEIAKRCLGYTGVTGEEIKPCG